MTLTTVVDQMSILSGDRTKLKDLLRQRLMECGWHEQVSLMCREAIKEMGSSANVDQIVARVTPKARTCVPDPVKKELLLRIKESLSAQENIEIKE
ncbi:enhancer of yellow 2 transcription factor-like [Condylostylus longicornis]|uniref:enhancer of yellow 2 transcription factor-like n=1 Tax=Condylostylus longicornis TaxID=2530218 RepID=UPI00244D9D6A|nr:enhancer of yellow 2 transcription factor-like [Condylostylus longicornis]